MKKAITIILFACAGCRVTSGAKPGSATVPVAPAITRSASLTTQPAPHLWNLSWTPGQYTNFVVITSSDIRTPLAHWQTYAVTSQTNVQFVTTESRQYFAVYGTNPADGQSAWGGNR